MSADAEFEHSGGRFEVTDAMREAYNTYGYIIIRKLINQQEVQKVKAALEDPEGVTQHAYRRSDGKDRTNAMVLWNHPGKDVTGILARTNRIAGTMEQLLGGDEVYHYHTKLVMKEAHTGGTFVWHQDYGYWYRNGCLAPEMGSVFIPMDDTDLENGCLQIIPGSHKLGRIDHVYVGEQQGAEPERVQQARKKFGYKYVEMKAGDVLFFHCNLLHTSNKNESDRRRWVFIVAFNKRTNDPYISPRYTPLIKVDDSALMECKEVKDLQGKCFLKYEEKEEEKRSHQQQTIRVPKIID